MEIDNNFSLIHKIPFFNNLQTNDLLCIMQYTKTHALAIDDFLFHQDDVPDGLYVLLEGKLKVTMFGNRIGDSSVTLAEVYPGQYVGEFGIFDGQPRSATVRAKESSKVLFLPSKAFEVMIITQPTIARYVLGNLCDLVIDQVHDKIKKEDVWNMIKAKNLRPDMKNMKILCEIIRENNKTLTGITSKGNGVLFRTQKSQGSA